MMRLLPWDYGIRNLGRSPSRLGLGVAGSGMVVLLVMAAAAFTRGMGGSLLGTGGSTNVILLGAGSEESIERSEVSGSTAGLAAASIPGIRQRLGVAYVSPEVSVAVPASLTEDGEKGHAVLRGVMPSALLVHERVRILEGRFPGPGELMAGTLAETRMGLPEGSLATGAGVWLDGRKWTVSGRFASPGAVFEAELWAPLQEVLVATTRVRISCVVVTMEDEEGMADADLFAKQRLDLEITAIPEREYYASLFRFFGPVRAMVWTTALLVGAGALLGGLNTLYAAFASRVRELAALQVLGFTRGALLIGMVQEAVLVASAGSIVAASLATVTLDGLAVRVSMGAFGLVVDGPVMATGLATGLLLGLVGALPPAWRCLKVPVAEGLKSE